MDNFTVNIVGGVISGLTLAGLLGLWRMLRSFIREQREANRRNAESIRSVQRAELTRMFQRVVEDARPVTLEELEHLEAVYAAYHENGGNGTGTLMYERIKRHAVLKTKADGDTGGEI